MHDLRVPDLGEIVGPWFHLLPIDAPQHRQQLAQTVTGVGRSFVDVRPRGGLAIINAATRTQTSNAGAQMLTRGIATTIPVRGFDAPNSGAGQVQV